MTSLQLQARALGDPTRHEVFRFIAESARFVHVAELAEHLGLHHNAIRQHLAKLVEAGLLAESIAPSAGRGRPRLRYTIDATADSRWGVAGPYERLSSMLTEIIRTKDSAVDVGRRAGRLAGRRAQLGSDDVADPVAGLSEQMAHDGFEPSVEQCGDHVEITLEACPFETTAIVDPATVCGLHLGLALGAADSLSGLVIDELIPKDPRRGQCRLRCHLER